MTSIHMNSKYVVFFLLFLIGISCKRNKKTNNKNRIKIEWVENLKGDFSFKEKWSYPTGIIRNLKGDLRMDSGMLGFVSPEAEKTILQMYDEAGQIPKDSLPKYYQLIDTTHIYHSIKSIAKVYESTVYDVIEFKRMKNGVIKGETINDVSGYSLLHIKLDDNYCYAWNDYKSHLDLRKHIFYLKNGKILIDKPLFEKGIIKAIFDFNFKNTLEKKDKLSWKGKIYSKIINE